MKHGRTQVGVSGVLPDDGLYSEANSASIKIAAVMVPQRLDEALRYAVSRVEADPQNVEAIVRHLGWDGKDGRHNDRLDPLFVAADQRLQRIVDRAIDRLRAEGIVPEVVERSIALVERLVPVLESELGNALLNAKLSHVRFSCSALASAAAVFRKQIPFEVVNLRRNVGLVKSGATEGVNQLAARAQDLVHSCGCANLPALADDARAILGPNANERFIEAVVRTIGCFEWLDRENGWFWYIPDPASSSNRLVDQIQQMLVATPRIQLDELRMAIRRRNDLGGFTPPVNVLASICRRLLFAHIEGDVVARVHGSAQRNAALAHDDKTFADLLQLSEPVRAHNEFEPGHDGAMNEDAFDKCTSASPIPKKLNPNRLAFVRETETLAPAKSEEIRTSSGTTRHGFLCEDEVFIAWKLQLPAFQDGLLRVPEPLSPFLQGDYKVRTIANLGFGDLHFYQRACWDVRRVLRGMAAEIGDTLVLILSLRDHVAISVIGDDDVVAEVISKAEATAESPHRFHPYGGMNFDKLASSVMNDAIVAEPSGPLGSP